MSAARAGHLLPTLALTCAAASGWVPVPTAAVLVAASIGLHGLAPRAALGAAVAALSLVAGVLGAVTAVAPLDVAWETLVDLRRLLDAFGPAAAAAALATHPVRAVAAVAEGAEWWGVAAGLTMRSAGLVAIGAALAQVPAAARRDLGRIVAGILAVFVVAALAIRL